MPMATTSSIDFVTIAIALLGGLSLFLFGMEQMTEALKNIAGEKLKGILGKFTGNRFSAVFTGAFVTAVIQSSSVTTVLVVGFISAGMMTLTQSVGVIMGANIGTTITAQIIAFKVSKYAMLLIASGFLLRLISKREQLKWFGVMLFGLGLIFFGMELMSQATYPLRSYEPFINIMASMKNPFYGIGVATLFTALVQSSSATTGIVIVLASQGFISLESGIALALGANIGTCATALLSTIGKPREALQAAVVHVTFNIAGALLWVFLIDYFAIWVRDISPVAANLSGVEKMAAEVPRQIANAHTIFNVVNTILFIGFTVPMANLARKLVPAENKIADKEKALYLNPDFLITPDLAINQLRLEVAHLGTLTNELLKSELIDRTEADNEIIIDKIEYIEELSDRIIDYSRKISISSNAQGQALRISNWTSIAQFMRSIAETISINNRLINKQKNVQNSLLTDSIKEKQTELGKDLYKTLNIIIKTLQEADYTNSRKILKSKSAFNKKMDEIYELLNSRLQNNEKIHIKTYQSELEIIELYRRIHYFLRRIGKTFPEK